MKSKRKISLSLKVTLLVIIIIPIVVFTNLFINSGIEEDNPSNPVYESQYDKADVLIYGLNLSVSDYLDNSSYLNNIIEKYIDWNDEVIEININIYESLEDLIIKGSSNKNKTGQKANSYIIKGEDYNKKCSQEDNTYYIPFPEEDPPYMVILSPINNSIKNIGTYEIIVSMEKAYHYIKDYNEAKLQYSTMMSLILLFSSIAVFLVILRRIIVNPITKFRDNAKTIGSGNLDAKVDIKSRDEFGDLAETFNNMALELKKSRDKIEDYNRILEKLLDQKDDFIGQLGHDLKNPMQPLVGLLPILIDKEKDPENKEMLKVMHTNVEYMQDLIFDTLKLAKLRSDNIDFNYEKIDLKNLSDKVVVSQKTMLDEKNIKIVNKIKENIFVYADKLRLSEVFKNLINNCVKYSKKSSGKITLNAEKENKDYVKISISDNGIGMTKEQIKKVFDEFYKADKQTSDYYSTGLGLAICKRIVEKHGGKIWVDSPGPGKGSTFYFTIRSNKFSNNEK